MFSTSAYSHQPLNEAHSLLTFDVKRQEGEREASEREKTLVRCFPYTNSTFTYSRLIIKWKNRIFRPCTISTFYTRVWKRDIHVKVDFWKCHCNKGLYFSPNDYVFIFMGIGRLNVSSEDMERTMNTWASGMNRQTLENQMESTSTWRSTTQSLISYLIHFRTRPGQKILQRQKSIPKRESTLNNKFWFRPGCVQWNCVRVGAMSGKRDRGRKRRDEKGERMERTDRKRHSYLINLKRRMYDRV